MNTYLVITHGGEVFNGTTFSIAVSDKSPLEVLKAISKKEPFFGELTITHEGPSDAHGTCFARIDEYIDGGVDVRKIAKEITIVVDQGVKTHVV